MFQFLNNPWVIGIGGGILSGFVVTFVSRYMLSKRDSREYNQKVLSANREIIYAIRPGISETHIPDRIVAEALMKATARKYGVDSKDLHTPAEIAQELIKEVMDSSFISSKIKNDYCAMLSSLSESPVGGRFNESEEFKLDRSLLGSEGLEDYRARMVTMMSIMLGLLSAMMTILMVFTRSEISITYIALLKEKAIFLLPIVFSLISAFLAVSVVTRYKEIRMRSEKGDIGRKKKIDEDVKRTDFGS